MRVWVAVRDGVLVRVFDGVSVKVAWVVEVAYDAGLLTRSVTIMGVGWQATITMQIRAQNTNRVVIKFPLNTRQCLKLWVNGSIMMKASALSRLG